MTRSYLSLLALLLAVAGCGGEDSRQAAEGEAAPEGDATAAGVADTTVIDSTVAADLPVAEQTAEGLSSEPAAGPEGSWSMTMGELSLEVVGDSVTGEYPLGTLSGVLDGHRLVFDYAEGTLTGTGLLEFDDCFESFAGHQLMAGDTLQWTGDRL